MFVAVDKHQRFKFFISQTTSIRLELSSTNLKSRMLVISKLLNICSKCTLYDVSAGDGFGWSASQTWNCVVLHLK